MPGEVVHLDRWIYGDDFLCARPGINPNSSGHGIAFMMIVLMVVGVPVFMGALIMALRRRDSKTPTSRLSAPGSVPGDDGRLKVQIRVALREHPDTADLLAGIEVLANKGVVTLVGQVNSEEQRSLVENVVRQAVGGVKIINELTVAGGPGPGTEADASAQA